MSVPVAAAGKLIASRYRLEHQVGEGGMGSVWVAEDEKLGRWVAVKLLGKAGVNRSVRERFAREAMAIAKLRSPHVVQIFDYGTDAMGEAGADEVAYIVMELLSGQDLYTWLKENRPVPLAKVATIIQQAAKALSAAHRAGIIHRDLKPANIFVVRDHEEEVVKVFDFGLAKGIDDDGPLPELQDRTGEGVLLGTPRYMSPEQAHGARRVDHRTDLWSLGVIAYLAVTGRLPFEGLGVGEVITKIRTEPAEPPSQRMPEVRGDIDAFFERALAKEPEARFDSAIEMAEAFERAALGGGRTSIMLIPDAPSDTVVEPQRADDVVDSGPMSLGEQPTLEQAGIVRDDGFPESEPDTTIEPRPPLQRLRPGRLAMAVAALAVVGVGSYAMRDGAPFVSDDARILEGIVARSNVVPPAWPTPPSPPRWVASDEADEHVPDERGPDEHVPDEHVPDERGPDERELAETEASGATEPASAPPKKEPVAARLPEGKRTPSSAADDDAPPAGPTVTGRALELFDDRH